MKEENDIVVRALGRYDWLMARGSIKDAEILSELSAELEYLRKIVNNARSDKEVLEKVRSAFK